MKITEFITSERLKFEHLDNKNKALALLTSVKQEIKANDINIHTVRKAATDTVLMGNFFNQSEYLVELRITVWLLELYQNSGSFNSYAKFVPDTKEDNKRFEAIKKLLIEIFNKE
jgi:hypothetical protein